MTDLEKLVVKMEYKNRYIAALEAGILEMMQDSHSDYDCVAMWASLINGDERNHFLRILFQNSDWTKTEWIGGDPRCGVTAGYTNAECSTDWALAIMGYLDGKKIDKLVEWACEADE